MPQLEINLLLDAVLMANVVRGGSSCTEQDAEVGQPLTLGKILLLAPLYLSPTPSPHVQYQMSTMNGQARSATPKYNTCIQSHSMSPITTIAAIHCCLVPGALCALSHVHLTSGLGGRYCHYPHFPGEEAEAPRHEGTQA